MQKAGLKMVAILAAAASASGWAVNDKAPENLLTRADLEAQLRFIASDELAGRRTGTAGNDAAARYIAEAFRAAGVQTAPGMNDYLQPTPMLRTSPAPQSAVLAGRPLSPGDDFLTLLGEDFQMTAQVAAAGYGLDKDGKRDFQGVDLKGRIAAFRFGAGGNARRGMSLVRKKNAAASQQGAVAVIEFYKGRAWNRLSRFLKRSRISLKSTPEKSGAIPHLLVNDPDGRLFQQLQEAVEPKASIESGARIREDVLSSNVVGYIPGRDPALRDQFVVLSAHYDHIGSGEDTPGATPEDHIFNGARDNGMGVVALISAARSLAALPPARSILVAAVTGEEEGLLGSAYFVENSPVPLRQIVFNLNSDGGGYSDVEAVTVLGLGRTTAHRQVEAGCREFGLEAIAEPEEAEGFFNRSDNLNFAREGIPAFTFSPGFRSLEGEAMRHYHRPSDEADENFDFDYLLLFSQAFARSARLIADHPEPPRWSPGDSYEAAAQKLYGEN